jgi:hypothetical protein
MYMVRYNYKAKNMSTPTVAYKTFKTLEKAIEFSKTVDLIEIKEVPYE